MSPGECHEGERPKRSGPLLRAHQLAAVLSSDEPAGTWPGKNLLAIVDQIAPQDRACDCAPELPSNGAGSIEITGLDDLATRIVDSDEGPNQPPSHQRCLVRFDDHVLPVNMTELEVESTHPRLYQPVAVVVHEG